ncbi:hypothetical protein B4U79_15054, partial [Dinothrombium tinctorium]
KPITNGQTMAEGHRKGRSQKLDSAAERSVSAFTVKHEKWSTEKLANVIVQRRGVKVSHWTSYIYTSSKKQTTCRGAKNTKIPTGKWIMLGHKLQNLPKTLSEQSFNVLDRPAGSSNLNPIKNLLAPNKDRLKKRQMFHLLIGNK